MSYCLGSYFSGACGIVSPSFKITGDAGSLGEIWMHWNRHIKELEMDGPSGLERLAQSTANRHQSSSIR
jgi:hypothetical protein